MSFQFGRWNFDGRPVDAKYVDKVQSIIAPFGPDDMGSYKKGSVHILYRAFHTTKESHREAQPHVVSSGTVITWDGRLDNRADLISEMRDTLNVDATDVDIVATAYEQWGTRSFSKLIGDWALTVWNPSTRSLVLAKDFVGTRNLYYSLEKDRITWSTILDPLVLFAGRTLTLCGEYIAGWLSFLPAPQLTPYSEVHCVPPASFALVNSGKLTLTKYWDFDARKEVRYKTDKEYEEHFRTVFGEAVKRRLRSDASILAELSGGMDSSSIVCMADALVARGIAEAPRLDTVSRYDHSEPNWNDAPYFERVEQQRGRIGCHINVGGHTNLWPDYGHATHFVSAPGGATAPAGENPLLEAMTAQGNRVLLSGVGGDEVLGGVPTPIPELADLLACAEFRKLAHCLKVWSLAKKRPWLQLLLETTRSFFPPSFTATSQNTERFPWLQSGFARRHSAALRGYETRRRLLFSRPSFQGNISTLNMLRRQMAISGPSLAPLSEKRYPYLDRDLLEFIYAIPREQLVRPHQRRSLMRRALIGIVPDEILNRKRKAFVVRGPMVALANHWPELSLMTRYMTSESLGIVDHHIFTATLNNARNHQEVNVVGVLRTIAVEQWLTHMKNWNVVHPQFRKRSEIRCWGKSSPEVNV